MNVKQFRYHTDNFSYLIYGKKDAIAIDPGATDAILEFADVCHLDITHMINTHSHHDHTCGNAVLLRQTNAQFIDCCTLATQKFLNIDNENLLIFHTPGHMDDCLTFQAGNMLITGDTLFNGTIGNCFSGDMAAFFRSIRFLCTFDPDTIIYSGHDYVKDAMTYSRIIDPANPDIDRYLEQYHPDHVFSKLKDEFKVNPYLRYNDPGLIRKMKQNGFAVDTEFNRFISLYEWG